MLQWTKNRNTGVLMMAWTLALASQGCATAGTNPADTGTEPRDDDVVVEVTNMLDREATIFYLTGEGSRALGFVGSRASRTFRLPARACRGEGFILVAAPPGAPSRLIQYTRLQASPGMWLEWFLTGEERPAKVAD